MANKAILTYNTSFKLGGVTKQTQQSQIFTLLENVSTENITDYFSIGEVMPEINFLISAGAKLFGATEGTISQGLLDLKNIMDAPMWAGTKPITINLKLGLFTETDAELDVWRPAIDLIGMSILTKNPSGSYSAPGLNLITYSAFKNKKKTESELEGNFLGAKLISIDIPGIIYLPVAMVMKVTPTYSKQITTTGFPLWVDLDCQFTGTTPATTEFYEASRPSWKNTLRRIGQVGITNSGL
jgi:hypothetical protein